VCVCVCVCECIVEVNDPSANDRCIGLHPDIWNVRYQSLPQFMYHTQTVGLPT